jgi:ppGpp synthetase/RelA/SpoT-type nucleotidyltranferase
MSLEAKKTSIVSAFLEEYPKKKESYMKAAEAVADICAQALRDENLFESCLIKKRAKALESLQVKLEARARDHGRKYDTMESIEEDIVDLSGVRVACRDLADISRVQRIVQGKFIIIKEKDHGKLAPQVAQGFNPQFSGYDGVHYLVRLKEDDVIKYNLQSCGAGQVEIQVMTITHTSYADAQHGDYKDGSSKKRKLARQYDNFRGVLAAAEGTALWFDEEKVRHEEKNAQPFATTDCIGHYFRKWIDQNGPEWARREEPGHSPTLATFLTACSMNTPKALASLLDAHFGPDSEERYSSTRREYAPVEINLVIYLLDRVLLAGPETRAAESGNPLFQIRAIMSAIIWTSKLFRPEWEWQDKLLVKGDRETLRKGLNWLDSIEQLSFLSGEPLEREEDIQTLNGLWGWFEQHNERPIRLAFAMAKRGVLRDIATADKYGDLRYVLHPFLDALKWSCKTVPMSLVPETTR